MGKSLVTFAYLFIYLFIYLFMVYLTMLSKDHVQIFSHIRLFIYLLICGLFNDGVKTSCANLQSRSLIYLFICGLFNDAVKRSGYIVRMIG
jgi:hypothetical protein